MKVCFANGVTFLANTGLKLMQHTSKQGMSEKLRLNPQLNASNTTHENMETVAGVLDTHLINKSNTHASEASFFQTYHRDSLKETARQDFINGWQIDYLAFADEATADQPPIIILGGAFQNFNSYKYCVAPLLKTAPVILIDLPATGSNVQTHNTHLNQNAKEISMVELSALLANWINSVGLDTVSMMGMSLGSVVAANFAAAHPEKMHRLVLMGVMQRTRKSWRMLIEESLVELDNQRMNDFGEAVVLYLVNHAKLEKTRMSGLARRMFHEQMAGFTYNEQLRYRINAHRLLNVTQVPTPSCPTLVATGQYDSFTLPHENASFALACDDATYAMIENADHVPQLQKRKETLALFTTFLANQPIDQLKNVRVLSKADMGNMERRSEQRVLVNSTHQLQHKKGKRTDDVQLIDVSFFGILFAADTIERAAFIFAENRDMLLTLHDEQGAFTLELLLFEQKARQIRALFKHGSFAKAERLKAYIEKLAAQNVTQLAAG